MHGRKVLIVEDHQESRESLATALKKARFDVLEAGSLKAAYSMTSDGQVAVIVSELKLPDGDGLSLLGQLKKNGLECPIVFVTAFGTMSSAIQAMKMGAADFLTKPATAKDLTEAVSTALRRWDQQHGRESLEASAQAIQPQNVVIGVSRAMRELFSLVERVAPYGGNVLICGESGSGKEVIAREIHRFSPRRDHPFVPVNCASVSDELLENELFGHERGAFTGANEKKIGVFETANEGTLFLDEINEMGLRSQAKLLRALERKEFRRLGGTQKVRTNLRLISATNVSLEDEVGTRRFREDLYYRIKVVTLIVPPLRERKDDIPYLIKAFLAELERTSGKSNLKITPEALARLQRYLWPGNVRELKNVVESMVLMTEGDTLDVDNLPQNIRGGVNAKEIKFPVGVTMEEAEKEIIRRYLEYFPTKKQAAHVLRIGLRTLHHKVKKFGLPWSGCKSLRKPSTIRSSKYSKSKWLKIVLEAGLGILHHKDSALFSLPFRRVSKAATIALLSPAKYKSNAVFALLSAISNHQCKICTRDAIPIGKLVLKTWSGKKFPRTFSNLASSKKTASVLRLA